MNISYDTTRAMLNSMVYKFNGRAKADMIRVYRQELIDFENSIGEILSQLNNSYVIEGETPECISNISSEIGSLLNDLKKILDSFTTYNLSGMSLEISYERRVEEA